MYLNDKTNLLVFFTNFVEFWETKTLFILEVDYEFSGWCRCQRNFKASLFPPWIRLPTLVPSEMWRRLRKRFLSKKVKQQERPRQRHFQMRPDKKNISTMFSGKKIKRVILETHSLIMIIIIIIMIMIMMIMFAESRAEHRGRSDDVAHRERTDERASG